MKEASSLAAHATPSPAIAASLVVLRSPRRSAYACSSSPLSPRGNLLTRRSSAGSALSHSRSFTA
jgi:hypothetical protein